MGLPFEQELLALPLNKLLQLTAVLTELYPEQAAEAGRKSDDQQKRIANRLIESVLPIFVNNENGRPRRLGTCVLALIDGNFFAFTAGHVLDEAAASTLLIAAGGKLTPLPYMEGFRSIKESHGRDLDFAVIPLSANRLGALAQKVFLSLIDIDEVDMPDQRSLSYCYVVIGFPESRKLYKIDHGIRRIHQLSSQIYTSLADSATYKSEGLSASDHVVLEYDRERMMYKGQEQTAPDPRGISGGGIFCINKQTELGPLVAIGTEHRSKSRIMVATRAKHFLNAARQLNLERPDLFE